MTTTLIVLAATMGNKYGGLKYLVGMALMEKQYLITQYMMP